MAAVATDANKALVRKVFDELANRGNFAVSQQIYRADYLDHQPFPGAPARGPEGAATSIGQLRVAFPDLHVSVEEMSAHGDYVASHNIWRGTHRGEVLGIPPTGREMAMAGVVVFRVQDGLIAERWAIGLDVSLVRELGLGFRWSSAPKSERVG